jgi:hypothetical protein
MGVQVHINRPSSTRFIARVRLPGCKRYRVLGKPTRSYRVALRRMITAFESGTYKRGDVLVSADYYDPTQVCEIVSS